MASVYQLLMEMPEDLVVEFHKLHLEDWGAKPSTFCRVRIGNASLLLPFESEEELAEVLGKFLAPSRHLDHLRATHRQRLSIIPDGKQPQGDKA